MRYEFIFGYARLSKDDDDRQDESNSIANQKLMIRQYIQGREEFRGAHVEFCVDDGYSGTNYNRPGFQKMMELVKSREHSLILVKELSRLGRDTVDTQNYIEKVFPFMQVRFIAINDGYDSEDPVTKRKDSEAKFKNLVNGIYPQICSQSIKQVMRKQAESGKYHGGFPPYGYQFKGEDRTALYIDPEAASVVRKIFDKRLTGKKYTEIARELNEEHVITPAEYLREKGFAYHNNGTSPLWRRNMVKKILLNPIYTGTMVNHKTERVVVARKSGVDVARRDWICVPGMHEAIIPQEEFDKIQPVQDSGVHHRIVKKPANIFKGKIKCGYCKRAIRIRMEPGFRGARGYCSTVRYSGETQCYKKGFSIFSIENVVLSLVRQQAAIADKALKEVRELNKTLDIPKLEKEIGFYEGKTGQCAKEKRKLYESYVSGEISKERRSLKSSIENVRFFFEWLNQRDIKRLAICASLMK